MLKIGITGGNFISWGGGLDFLRTVVSSLYSTSAPMELHFLIPGRGPRATLQRLDANLRHAVKAAINKKVVYSYAPSRADIKRTIDSFGIPICVHEIDIGERDLLRKSRFLGLDVLLPSFTPLPFGQEMPWLGYIYDFQHRILPDFFSERERSQRDHQFTEMLRQAPAIIVNAKAVASDISKYYPESLTKVFPLPFSTAPSSAWLEIDSAVARVRYGIPERYFIVCNQFWLHKNHMTAFVAFAKLARSPNHSDIHLVCTGATSDYRSYDYFESLLGLLRQSGVESRVHILGYIPKLDQIALLKGAVALLQPTLCEGGPGGGAVYDAIALGVPSIVSNISVNTEINEPEVVFFEAADANALYARMKSILNTALVRKPDLTSLIERGYRRRKDCGNVILEAIDYVCGKKC